ncbi:MAG: ABC transporter ATP-binding protein [Chlamydiae bacterium]|nr:ABC transporter ATP-binding protein [Chlamydiota bacterium]
MTSNLAIDVRNIVHSYDRNIVLENVNFEVKQGDFIGIFGPNGGGKTTLLKLLMGFEKPTSGKIKLFGKSPEKLRPYVGYVPQIQQLDKRFPITVLEIVMMAFLSKTNLFGKIPKKYTEKALEALAQVGLENKINHTFGTLSGGQAQRVLIARAIANDPKILFLDEPTASVDPQAEEEILHILDSLKGQTTILMVTHDLQTILNKVEGLLCVHRQVHRSLPNQICEHFGLGLYHTPITTIGKPGKIK